MSRSIVDHVRSPGVPLLSESLFLSLSPLAFVSSLVLPFSPDAEFMCLVAPEAFNLLIPDQYQLHLCPLQIKSGLSDDYISLLHVCKGVGLTSDTFVGV